MDVILAVFRSRTQTQIFVKSMREGDSQCSVVPTPPEARVGCGISAKFRSCDLHRAKTIISRNRLYSFYGFYSVQRIVGRTVVKKYF